MYLIFFVTVIVTVIMILAMFIFYFCIKQQDKHCIRHYDCDYECDYDKKKIRYKYDPLVFNMLMLVVQFPMEGYKIRFG